MTPTERKREELRALTSARYNGTRHLAVNTLICLCTIALCLTSLQSVSIYEGLVPPATFLFINLVEYSLHRWPMHHQLPGLTLFFRRHALEHHAFYTQRDMAFETMKDIRLILFPTFMIALYILIIGCGVALLINAVWSRNASLLFLSTAVAYLLNYEWFHFAYHTPPTHWLSRLPGMQSLRRLHITHHDPANMARANFNITYPICDWVFASKCSER